MTIDSPDSEPLESQGPPQLELQEHRLDGECTLVLRGELDMASAPTLDVTLRRLCTDGTDALTLDLSELTFTDSTGLRALLLAGELCQQYACTLVVVPGSPQIQRLFELTGMLGQLPFQTDAQTPNPTS
jgi:anti-sigma B factor antagonist